MQFHWDSGGTRSCTIVNGEQKWRVWYVAYPRLITETFRLGKWFLWSKTIYILGWTCKVLGHQWVQTFKDATIDGVAHPDLHECPRCGAQESKKANQ